MCSGVGPPKALLPFQGGYGCLCLLPSGTAEDSGASTVLPILSAELTSVQLKTCCLRTSLCPLPNGQLRALGMLRSEACPCRVSRRGCL